jgi:NAD(P)-dependent dehydrogenase (short-subunit alcohol dehydrogenase family)
MDAFSLRDRVALVAGASSGIGLHLAGVFARAGAAVALAARRKERIDDDAAQLRAKGHHAAGVVLDVLRPETFDAAFDAIVRELGGPPDVLLNCAGIIVTKPFLEQTEAEFDAVLDTNLRGAFFVAQRAAAGMVALGRGSIINVASTAGLRPGGYLSSYGASKAALIHLTKVMAFELARHGVRVNVLCPGNIETDMLRISSTGLPTRCSSASRSGVFGQTKISPARHCSRLGRRALHHQAVLAVDGGQLVNSLRRCAGWLRGNARLPDVRLAHGHPELSYPRGSARASCGGIARHAPFSAA